jgi:hypothetical protein
MLPAALYVWSAERTPGRGGSHTPMKPSSVSSGAPDRAKEGPLRLGRDRGPAEVRVQVRFKRVVTGHRVCLAAFFAQTYPQAPLLDVDVLDAHRERRPHPGERKHHQRDQRPIAQASRRRDIESRGVGARPSHSARTGKTPVLEASEARQLLDSIARVCLIGITI